MPSPSFTHEGGALGKPVHCPQHFEYNWGFLRDIWLFSGRETFKSDSETGACQLSASEMMLAVFGFQSALDASHFVG